MSILSQHIGVFDSKKFNEFLNSFYEDDNDLEKKVITKKKNSNFCKFCGEFECIIDDGGYVCYNVYFEREETEQEKEDRILLDLIRNEQIKKRDLRNFEEIKLKYNL